MTATCLLGTKSINPQGVLSSAIIVWDCDGGTEANSYRLYNRRPKRKVKVD